MNTLIRATVFLRTTDWTLLRFDCFEKGKNVMLNNIGGLFYSRKCTKTMLK
jgi:hypothetical protein